jgi:hypothetical protein
MPEYSSSAEVNMPAFFWGAVCVRILGCRSSRAAEPDRWPMPGLFFAKFIPESDFFAIFYRYSLKNHVSRMK